MLSVGLRLLEFGSVVDLASSLGISRDSLEIMMRDGFSSEMLLRIAEVLGKSWEEVGGWALDYQFASVADRVDISEKDWGHPALAGSVVFCRREPVRMDLGAESERRVRAALVSMGNPTEVTLEDVAKVAGRSLWGNAMLNDGRLETIAKFLCRIGWAWDPFLEKYVVPDPREPEDGQERLNYRVRKILDPHPEITHGRIVDVAKLVYGREITSPTTLAKVGVALKACGWNFDASARMWVRG